MTVQNAIKKAEKLSGEKVQVLSDRSHTVNYKGHTVSFYPNGRLENNTAQAVCFYTKKHGVEDDITTDYFSGTFHDNLTQAFRFLDRQN